MKYFLFIQKTKFFLKMVGLFSLASIISINCYAAVDREDIISLSLDYYQLKVKKIAKEKSEEEKKITKQAEEVVFQENQQVRGTFKDFFKEYIKPNLKFNTSLEAKYNDNIFRTNTDQYADWTTRFNVDLALDYSIGGILAKEKEFKTGHTDIAFGLRGPSVELPLSQSLGFSSDDNVRKDEKDDLYKPRFSGYGSINYMRQKYGFEASYKLNRNYADVVDIGTETELASRDKGRVYYWVYDYQLDLIADWNRLPTQIVFHRNQSQYPTEYESSDVISDTISLINNFKLTNFTSLVFQYDYENNQYSERTNDDWSANTAWLGIDGTFFRGLQFAAKYGQKKIEFEDGDSKNEGTVDIAFNYIPKPGARLVPSLEVKQNIITTPYENEKQANVFSVNFDMKILPVFLNKIFFEVGASLDDTEYGSGRNDTLTSYYFRTNYLMNTWTDIYFKYEHSENDSDEDIYSYDNNIFTTGVKISF
ncbi:MAG: outer membrane beta-barrel protein [Candidatus Omnitrophota bacterium]